VSVEVFIAVSTLLECDTLVINDKFAHIRWTGMA
jgi:hypothetical protein